MKIKIINAEVITLDEKNKVFENAEIHIEDGIIRFVGENAPEFIADRTIDADGNAVIPGFVNTHTHLPMNLFRSYADDMELMPWLSEKIWPAEDKIDEKAAYYGAMLGLAEMARAGITAFADAYYLYDWWISAVRQSGMRALLARSVVDFNKDEGERKFSEMLRMFHDMKTERINMGFAAHAPYTVSDTMFRRIAESAQKHNAVIQVHASETKKEVDDCVEQYGLTPIELLEETGMLDNHTIVAHCVWVTDNDIDILCKKGTFVSHCPSSNLKLASGISPVWNMMEKGVNISLGTDSASSNNSLSVWKEMMLMSMLQKGFTLNPVAVPVWQALKAAAFNGAGAMGINSGSIIKGKNADLIIIDTSGIRYAPKLGNTVSNIVYSGSDTDVVMTMVGGDILYENGNVTFCDVDECKAKVTEFSRTL